MRVRSTSLSTISPPPVLRRHPLRGAGTWLFVLPAALLLGLWLIPLAALLLRGFGAGALDYWADPMVRQALRLSLVTSTIASTLVLLSGTPLAYALARWEFRGRAALDVLLDLTLVLPPAVAGVALLIAFGRRGLLGPALAEIGVSLPFTTAAVVMAQIFVAAPFFVRAARIGFDAIDPQLEEAATTEGASQWQLFRFVMLPLAGRSVLSGLVLCWTRALGEFGATILFAGNMAGRTQTMPLAIYLGFERNVGVALALSVLLLLVSGLLLLALRRLERNALERD
jgi:molybdate transport system permease protein